MVDASVLVAALIDGGSEGKWAESLFSAHDLYAPALTQVEATNALRRLEGMRQITTPEADQAQTNLMRLNLELVPFERIARRVWELRRNVTSYDACYISAAEALDLPLATLDMRLTQAAGPRCRFLTP